MQEVRRGPYHQRDIGNVQNLVTNLDSFAGNSGSGIFSSATNQMVGILVTGGEDWTITQVPGGQDCSVAHVQGAFSHPEDILASVCVRVTD
eukprot:SAG25_NODE_245_length_11100_cov_4.621671_9_plen_91_part_00